VKSGGPSRSLKGSVTTGIRETVGAASVTSAPTATRTASAGVVVLVAVVQRGTAIPFRHRAGAFLC
jgi:hypothetical protein